MKKETVNEAIREVPLQKLRDFKEKNLIKVLTGIRRSGKSVIMQQFQNELKATGIKDEQIISLNFELLENEELLNYRVLHEYIKARQSKSGWTYVFLDEIQLVENFQKTINSLRAKENIDIYITGSNSYILSGELATLLTGRYIVINVLPLSFKEYLSLRAGAMDNFESKKRFFLEYLKNGGFPQTLGLSTDRNILDYLDDVYSAIIRKDILARGKSVHEGVLTSIAKFIFHSVGSEISTINIVNTLKTNKREVSYNTVEKYLEYLKAAYLVYEVSRYDVKGRQHLKKNAKFYAVDTGMRNMMLQNKADDIGHILENVVFLELFRRGGKISVGKLGEKEIDFVVEKNKGLEYYQVSSSLLDSKTLQRELAPLKEIKDNHPKFIITLDDYTAGSSYEGIEVINAIDFVLNK